MFHVKYCCDDKSCYDCYVALAVVAGTVSVRNLRETDKIALAAYTGAQLIEVEEVCYHLIELYERF